MYLDSTNFYGWSWVFWETFLTDSQEIFVDLFSDLDFLGVLDVFNYLRDLDWEFRDDLIFMNLLSFILIIIK